MGFNYETGWDGPYMKPKPPVVVDQYDDRRDVWVSAPPGVHDWFIVDRCEWNADYTIRTIHAWHHADERMSEQRTTPV